jgi:hypothetical protein
VNAGLVELAQRYVDLTAELDDVRGRMKALLLNGAGNGAGSDGEQEPRANKRRASGKPSAVEIEANERALIEAITANPGAGPRRLAEITGARPNTTVQRLQRLEARGLIERDARGKRRVLEARPT